MRALLQPDLLTDAARAELISVVSMKTGDAIGSTSADDPHGFGLGVSGFTAPTLGDGWSYEGGTMGYRAVYVFVPADDIVAAVALNSQPNAADEQIGKLVAAVFEAARQ